MSGRAYVYVISAQQVEWDLDADGQVVEVEKELTRGRLNQLIESMEERIGETKHRLVPALIPFTLKVFSDLEPMWSRKKEGRIYEARTGAPVGEELELQLQDLVFDAWLHARTTVGRRKEKLLSVAQVAKRLGCSVQYARRVCPKIEGAYRNTYVLPEAKWVVPETALDGYIETQKSTKLR